MTYGLNHGFSSNQVRIWSKIKHVLDICRRLFSSAFHVADGEGNTNEKGRQKDPAHPDGLISSFTVDFGSFLCQTVAVLPHGTNPEIDKTVSRVQCI